MRFWFTLGFGLILGTVFGFFLASFLLFDDVQDRPRQASNQIKTTDMVAHAATKIREEPPPKAAPVVVDSKPAAVAAEAVDLNAITVDESNAISTAKRESNQTQEIQPPR